jgi:large conductance mechanosensitive channel
MEMFKEFRDFIKRGNVMDLAVAVILAVAFGAIIKTLVEGVIMPPIGLLLGKADFASLFYVLDTTKGVPKSLAEAKQMGVPVIAYGQLLNDIINFLIIAFVVFLIVRSVNRIKDKEEKEETKKDCPRCLSKIPIKATRCAECCVDLEAA